MVKLPEDLLVRLRSEAGRREMTVSDLTREAIDRHLSVEFRELRAAGAGRSGRDDISVRIEEILAGEVAP